MKPKQPPPIKVPKDKPYCFSGWIWKGDKWRPVFAQKAASRKKAKQAWRELAQRIEELDEMLDRKIG